MHLKSHIFISVWKVVQCTLKLERRRVGANSPIFQWVHDLSLHQKPWVFSEVCVLSTRQSPKPPRWDDVSSTYSRWRQVPEPLGRVVPVRRGDGTCHTSRCPRRKEGLPLFSHSQISIIPTESSCGRSLDRPKLIPDHFLFKTYNNFTGNFSLDRPLVVGHLQKDAPVGLDRKWKGFFCPCGPVI